MKRKKLLFEIIKIVLVSTLTAVLLFGFVRLAVCYLEFKINEAITQQIFTDAVIDLNSNKESASNESPCTESDNQSLFSKPFTIDFSVVNEQYPFVEAWIYCEGTPINYPVVHFSDNKKYYDTALDDSANANGTLFINCSNNCDFIDTNTIIYGNHMCFGSMFGSLSQYRSQRYFERHPYLLLFTKTSDYKIELIAESFRKENELLHLSKLNGESLVYQLQNACQSSGFQSEIVFEESDHYITLAVRLEKNQDRYYTLFGKLTAIE